MQRGSRAGFEPRAGARIPSTFQYLHSGIFDFHDSACRPAISRSSYLSHLRREREKPRTTETTRYCMTCGQPGHLSTECRQQKPSHRHGEPSHMAPKRSFEERKYFGRGKTGRLSTECRRQKPSHRHDELGHTAAQCTTNKTICFRCVKPGHLFTNCLSRMRFHRCGETDHMEPECPRTVEKRSVLQYDGSGHLHTYW